MKNKVLTALALAATVAVGAFAGFKVARYRRYVQKENGCYD